MKNVDNWYGHPLSGSTCPVCGESYRLVDILQRKERICKVVVQCKRCGTYGLGTALIFPEPALEDGPVELLEHHEATGPVGTQDVRGIREFLHTFDGDFKRLFGEARLP